MFFNSLLFLPSFVVSSHTHFAIIHLHFIHANFYFILLVSVYESVVLGLAVATRASSVACSLKLRNVDLGKYLDG